MKKYILLVLPLLLALALLGCETPAAQASPAPTEAPATVEAAEVSEITLEETPTAVALTPAPTDTPAPTEVPTDTPVPTEAPTPTPEPLTFTESVDMPLPTEALALAKGRPFSIDGLVQSTAPLTKLRAVVSDQNGKTKLDVQQTFEESENVTECRLLDLTFSRDVTCLSELIRFEKLATGTYTLRLYAETAALPETLLAETTFKVGGSTWLTLQPNNLRGNYSTALAFFGSPERFMFRYRFRSSDSTLITVDGDWRDQYDAEAVVINGKEWRCHIDAVPYFEQAGKYLDNTYIHISGKGLNTGAVRLADLVTFNGSVVRRFVNSGMFVSHHSFGTAVDINAHYPSHRDILENRDKIYHEVHDNLTYNGIVEIDGKQCYDFTYTGTASAGLKRVPEPLMNYLLYELGFYRAGFSWGFYYPHTCDAMHFSLSELSPSYFTDSDYALRKVFTYIEDETPPEN